MYANGQIVWTMRALPVTRKLANRVPAALLYNGRAKLSS
jgi:hypothetical protein